MHGAQGHHRPESWSRHLQDTADDDDDDVGSSFLLAQCDEFPFTQGENYCAIPRVHREDEDDTLLPVATLESFDSEVECILNVAHGLRLVRASEPTSAASGAVSPPVVYRYAYVSAMVAEVDAAISARNSGTRTVTTVSSAAPSSSRSTRSAAEFVQRQVDKEEFAKYPKLQAASNGLGGRARHWSQSSAKLEASYAKQKKLRAEGVIAKVKRRWNSTIINWLEEGTKYCSS